MSLGNSESAIVGGTDDLADSAVFQLTIVGDNSVAVTCSATLIDHRTLLTAAHCLDPRTLGAQTVRVTATNRPDARGAGDSIEVIETRFHPLWNPNTLENDLGLGLLSTVPPGVVAKPWNLQSVATMSGLQLRAVGYGSTGAMGTSGVRREVALSFRQVTSSLILLGDQTGKGVCHGDSGGPSFHTFPDGVERLVGVHSYTLDSSCVDGADTRIDPQSAFLNEWMSQKETASCGVDGRCKADCPTVDPDCACMADGICSTACLDLARDPDCPADCVANGICSVRPCPVPDVDCAPMGGACANRLECVTRECVGDPQHEESYCTQACTGSADCPEQMECDATQVCHYKQLPLVSMGEACKPGEQACGRGQVCAGPVEATSTCAPQCLKDTDCGAGLRCELSYDARKYCGAPPTQTPQLTGEFAVAPAKGCSAVPGGMLLLALAGVLRQRRKR